MTYQVGLYFGLMGPNYRYEFPCIAIGELVIALAFGFAWRQRRGGHPSAAKNAPVSSSASGVPIS